MTVVNVHIEGELDKFVARRIHLGYATSKAEVIRQGLIRLKDEVTTEAEELELVHKAVEAEMQKIKTGKAKTYSLGEVKKELGF